MTVALDRRPPRELTSREIAKIISGCIHGILREEAAPAGAVHTQLLLLRELVLRERPFLEVQNEMEEGKLPWRALPFEHPGWRAALGGLVGAFTSWCQNIVVDNAITWILENWTEVTRVAGGKPS